MVPKVGGSMSTKPSRKWALHRLNATRAIVYSDGLKETVGLTNAQATPFKHGVLSESDGCRATRCNSLFSDVPPVPQPKPLPTSPHPSRVPEVPCATDLTLQPRQPEAAKHLRTASQWACAHGVDLSSSRLPNPMSRSRPHCRS